MTWTKKQALREGKAKILYPVEESSEHLIQFFKDDATAFNAQKRGTIARKGVINNTVSSWIFTFLETQGVATHFEKQLSEREMLVKRVRIIPVEVVLRNRATGSIVQRLGLENGLTFSTPLVEYFLKSDELGDPLISENHIHHFNWATAAELAAMKKLALRVNELLKPVFLECGLDLIDFKLEFGIDVATGALLLADEFTPDGCRLWDLKTGESMDKDRFRKDLGKVEESYEEVFQRLKQHFEASK